MPGPDSNESVSGGQVDGTLRGRAMNEGKCGQSCFPEPKGVAHGFCSSYSSRESGNLEFYVQAINQNILKCQTKRGSEAPVALWYLLAAVTLQMGQ